MIVGAAALDRFDLVPNLVVRGLPDSIQFTPNKLSHIIDQLTRSEPRTLIVSMIDSNGLTVAKSNPCRFVEHSPLLPCCSDLHGKSEETIGTNSAREFYEFA